MPNCKLLDPISHLLSNDDRNYLIDCEREIKNSYKKSFIRIFSTLNRKMSSAIQTAVISEPQTESTKTESLIIENWSAVQLIRVWLISLIDDEEEEYGKFINNLFSYSDMHELAALYASLPILKYPENWIGRCQEGVRSNIGLVQEAVIEHNKYPYLYLDESSWNQLVLKAFFTDKNVLNIYGLFERNNQTLAESVVDYIYERYSAKREIHPILWLLAEKFLPDRAVDILSESYEKCSDDSESFILRHVLSQYITLPSTDAREDVSGNSLEEVLKSYKKR